jgi:mRNA interferase RelE/StbE
MYSIWVAPETIKELGDVKRYPAKVARQLLLRILELSINPRPQDSIQIETGFRLDSGEYRIFYEVDNRARMVKVYLVGKRGDDEIYKRLKRLLG